MIRRSAGLALSAVLAVAALLLQACATGAPAVYGPISAEVPFGYTERQGKAGEFTVLIKMPGGAPATQLREFFDRRAGELCPGGVDRTNVFRVSALESYARADYVYGGAGVGSRARFGTELEGYVYCKPAPEAPSSANPVTPAATG